MLMSESLEEVVVVSVMAIVGNERDLKGREISDLLGRG